MAKRRYSDPLVFRPRINQRHSLKSISERTGRPVAEFVREAIDDWLENQEQDELIKTAGT